MLPWFAADTVGATAARKARTEKSADEGIALMPVGCGGGGGVKEGDQERAMEDHGARGCRWLGRVQQSDRALRASHIRPEIAVRIPSRR